VPAPLGLRPRDEALFAQPQSGDPRLRPRAFRDD
jgi:hypothetical protein